MNQNKWAVVALIFFVGLMLVMLSILVQELGVCRALVLALVLLITFVIKRRIYVKKRKNYS